MTATYEIKRIIGEPRPWNSQKGGPMLAYKIDAEADGKMAMGIEWSRKQTSRPPEVGEELVAHTEPGPFEGAPERLKVNYAATKELSGGSTYQGGGPRGSKGTWQPESERDPERSARILRQHSQEMALRFFAIQSGEGAVSNPDMQWKPEDVFKLANSFDADVNKAGQAAKEGASAPASRSDAAVPTAVNRTPSPSQPVMIDLQECAEALDTAGLTSGVAQAKVAEYMAFQLAPERCVKAIRNLTNAADLETQGATLKALKENTEKALGQPLPTGEKVNFDDIPY